jgi:hypothetical protein
VNINVRFSSISHEIPSFSAARSTPDGLPTQKAGGKAPALYQGTTSVVPKQLQNERGL